MKRSFLLLILMLVAAIGCSDETAAPTYTCEPGSTVTTATGFLVTGSGLTDTKFDFATATGFQSREVISIGTLVAISHTGDLVIGADTIPATFSITLPNITLGKYAWNDLTANPMGSGGTLTIGKGPAAGSYKGINGTTILDQSDEPNDAYRGRFCGTMKDSVGRTITVSSGLFVTE